MAQHDYVIDNSTGANVRADINNALLAISSNNSGSSAPSTTYALQTFANTTDTMLQLRNAANNDFVNLRKFDGSCPLPDGTNSAPSLFFDDDTNTGIYSSAADTFNIATGGTERMELGTTTIFNEDGADVDFRIEGDTEANLFYVDAGNDRIGIGTSSPDSRLHLSFDSGESQIRLTRSNAASNTNDYGRILWESQDDVLTGKIAVARETAENNGYMHFSTASGGTLDERMRIDSSGRLLLGTTTEGYTSADDLTVATTGHTGITIRSGTASLGTLAFSDGTSGSAEYDGYIQYDQDGRHMDFATGGGSVALTIDSSGRVGIGELTPSQTLQVGGDSGNACISLMRTNAAATTNAYGHVFFENDQDVQMASISGKREVAGGSASDDDCFLSFSTHSGSGGSNLERMRITSDGDMILGSTSSLGKLTVSKVQNDLSSAGGFANPHLRLNATTTTDNNGFTGIAYSASTLSNYGWTAGAQRISTGGGDAAFIFRHHNNSATGNERLRIIDSGHVLVGTTGVGGGLGGVRLQNPDNGSCRFGTVITSGTKTLIQFVSNGGNNIVGSISVGTSTTTYAESSDYRLKENESLISDGITRLKQLKPYRFNWKADSSTIIDGFFAHEVSSIVPQAVTGTKDAVAVEDDVEKGLAEAIGDPIYQGIDQSKLVPLLVAAVKELITKVETLEAA